MSRWKPKITREEVIALFELRRQENARLSSVQLANELKCDPAYVRATLARAGIALPRSKRKVPSLCGINQKILDKTG